MLHVILSNLQHSVLGFFMCIECCLPFFLNVSDGQESRKQPSLAISVGVFSVRLRFISDLTEHLFSFSI